MKTKILVLLLLAFSSVSIAQTTLANKLKITANITDNSAAKVNVQNALGEINTIEKADLVDVIEKTNYASLPVTGVLGKIYVTTSTNKIYRWNGSSYSEISATDISTTTKIFYLSQKGCISDADISLGSTTFGTDNTSAIQNVLNEASDGTHIKVIIDGKYSTKMLTIYSNTTIEARSQGDGFILRSGSDSPMFINSSVEDTGTIVNKNIKISGGIYNFNGTNQVHDNSTYGFISGMNLIGVENVWIEDAIFYAPATFTLWLINWRNVHISGCRVDVGNVVDNSDGFHFNGKGDGAWVSNNFFRTKDDAIAINSDDALPNTLPYQTHGDISNVFLTNNTLLDCRFGIRVLSGSSKITNVVIDGLFGQTAIYGIIVDNFWQQHATYTNLDGPGNIDNLTIKNIKLKVQPLAIAASVYKSTINISVIVRNLIIDNVERSYSGYTDAPIILIAQNYTVIENALITNIYDWVDGDATAIPLLYIEDATIRKLTLSNIYKKRASLVDAPVLNLVSGTISNLFIDNVQTDNVQSLFKLSSISSVTNVKMLNVKALNKTVAYPIILNNTAITLLEAKNSVDGNLWTGSGSITKAWSDNNFPESVYGYTESSGVNDTRYATTAYTTRDFLKKVGNIGVQASINTATPYSAHVLTLKSDATNSSIIALQNRNATQTWSLAVDESAVDDGNLSIIDRPSGDVKLSLTKVGVLKITNLAGTGDSAVGTDSAGNLKRIASNESTAGGYTPTFSNLSNVSSVSGSLLYTKIGSVVTVSGRITLTASSTSLCSLDFTVPFSSSTSIPTSSIGIANRYYSSVPQVGNIVGVNGSTVNVKFTSNGSTGSSDGVFVSFMYQVN